MRESPADRQQRRPEGSWRVGDEGRYVWIDHKSIALGQVPALEKVEHLILWNVRVPQGFYGSLPNLRLLDIRGGTAENLDPIAEARGLRALVVNQVRGLTNLDVLTRLTSLRYLQLYGLRHITCLPSLRHLASLRRADIGQMQALSDISGLADAPALEELMLLRKLAINSDSMKPFVGHPSLRAFTWFWEDVPFKQAGPVLDALPLPKVEPMHADEWLARHTPD